MKRADMPGVRAMPRSMTIAGAAVLVTLATFALAGYSRRLSEFPPLSLTDLMHFGFDPYVLGFAVQELVIPLALIYLFSSTALFRQIVAGEAVSQGTLKLFAALALIQLLFSGYDLGLLFLTGDHITFGFLVIVVGGLLGGWRVGMGLGLITMLVRGTEETLLYGGAGHIFSVYQMEGLWGLLRLPWGETFFWHYLINVWASLPVWAGGVAGLLAELLAERRFAPGFALGLGAGIDLVAGYLMAISLEQPPPLIYLLIPSMLVSGLALAAVALIVRNVQAEVTRREAEAAELALTRAELRALRAQINPHFLFNALNTIRYFVRTDPATARRLLLNLSEVFQRALRSGEFVPLRDELSYVEAYVALEKARLDERLRVEWSISAEAWLDHPVPTLILQPVVENAVIHGIARKAEGGTVRIAVERKDGDLLLSVEDDGVGIELGRLAEILDPAGKVNGTAIGLRNIDGRLRALYGADYGLIVESEVGCGTRVEIRIPVVGD